SIALFITHIRRCWNANARCERRLNAGFLQGRRFACREEKHSRQVLNVLNGHILWSCHVERSETSLTYWLTWCRGGDQRFFASLRMTGSFYVESYCRWRGH